MIFGINFHFSINNTISGAGIAQWYNAGYGLDERGFESRQGLGIFLFTTVSRPALESTQPPIQWAPGALSLGGKAVVACS
jgi:hypothetical protein